MPEQPTMITESKAITLQAIQAALAAGLATCITLAYPVQVTAANVLGNVASILLVLIGARIVGRMNADEKIKEANRGLLLLRDETAEKLAVMGKDDPLRPVYERHLIGLAEEIYRNTIARKYEDPGNLPAIPQQTATQLPTLGQGADNPQKSPK